ncbi:MAG: major facilitator superfamily transporter [Polaromonas sp.]|jgi:MFS family permease|nr:major facilitator superfamily transporter [Polaromonas sp.]
MSTPGTERSAAAIDLTEFRLHWRVVFLAMLGLGVAANASMLYAFGPLVIPLQNAFGWSRGDLQTAVSFLFAGAVIAAQLVGWLNHRYGMRRVTVVSLVALSLVFALMTQMGASIWWLYLMFTLLPIAGMGTIHITWSHLVNLWYERNRGLALAVMLSGTGLSAVFIPSAVTWVIGRWNWQAAFVLLALLPVVLVLPLALRWMETPARRRAVLAAQSGAAPEVLGMPFGQALRSGKFWMLNLALAVFVGAMVSMVSNTVPLLRDKGLSAAEASQIFAGFGISLIVGRVLVGYLIDRLWAPGVAAVALVMPAIGCLLLATTSIDQTGYLILATVLIGIGTGAEFDIAAFLVSRYFGMRAYGRLFGVHVSLITVASALAPWLFGLLYNSTGSYTAMLTICGAIFLVAPLLLLPLGRYPVFHAENTLKGFA